MDRPGQPDGIDRPLLVGRDRELQALHDSLAAARVGRGRLALIAGDPGIGKTRLADAFAEQARASGARVVWGRCWEAGGAPAYWPWIQVIRSGLRDVADGQAIGLGTVRDRLALILPELAGEGTDSHTATDPDTARFKLFDAIATVLRGMASDAPLVVILDDLHAADEPSLLLLGYVASELADARAMIAALYRDAELDSTDPRQALLTALPRHAASRRVDPSALGEVAIADLITHATGAPALGAAVLAIARETEGNPLFVSEVVRLLVDERRLPAAGDPSWRLTVPDGIKAVIGRRLDRLSTACRSVLQLASVIGREFGLELLAELGLERATILEAVGEATAARVVGEVPGTVGRWRFGHVLMRDVVYESLALPVRTGLHDRVGRALEGLAGSRATEYLSEIAYHAVSAAPGGDSRRAVEASRRAAAGASATAAHEEAVRHLRNALAVSDLDPGRSEVERCRLLIDLGEAQMRAGLADGRRTLREAGALADRLGLPDELARAAIEYGDRFVWRRAGPDAELIPFLERALAALGDREDGLRVRLLARLSGALRDEPSMARRAALSAEAVAIARRIGDPATLAYALIGRTTAIWGPDHRHEAATLVEEIERIAEATGDLERINDAQWMKFVVMTELGMSRATADAALARSVEMAERLRQPSATWYQGVIQSVFALASGRYEGLEELIRDTRESKGRGQEWDANVSYRLAMFALGKERDDLATVLPLLDAARVEAPAYWLFAAARVFVDAELGRHDEARRGLYAMVGNGVDALPRDNNWLWSLVHLASVAVELGEREIAQDLLTALEPFQSLAANASGEVIAGPVGRVVGELATLLGRWDVAEAAYQEAFELLERVVWPPWEGWTRLGYANMLRARGRPGDAAAAANELAAAKAIADRLGMPALARRVLQQEARFRGSHSGVGVVSEPTAGAHSPSSPNGAHTFLREGEVWAIKYGGPTIRLRDARGLQHLARLIASPGREVAAVDLVVGSGVAAATSVRAASAEAGLGGSARSTDPLLDAQARASYKERLHELQEEIEEAEAFGDADRASRHREEFDVLAGELTAAIGLGGRARTGPSPAERARQSVTKAIRDSIDRIARHDPDLGAHLRRTVRTGALCAYDPDPESSPRWIT